MAFIGMSLVLALSAVHLANGIGMQLYDCHTGYANGMWKKLWDAKWKAWCCEHESLGCPSTSTVTITSTSETTKTGTTATVTTETTTTTTETSTATATVTTTTTNLGCWNTNCTSEGDTATCAARIKVAHGNPDFWTKANEHGLKGDEQLDFVCTSAVMSVKSQCSSCHNICSAESYCEGKNMQDTCLDTSCSFNGVSDTCSNRLTATLLTHPDVKNSATPCLTASELVNSQCPVCGVCSSKWWCAQQGEMGPPPAAEPHRSEELQTTMCAAHCEVGGYSASCGDRIHWAMTNNPQVSMSTHACLAASELVKSQCPACGGCSGKWFCAQPAQKESVQNMMFKYASVATDGFLARAGLAKPMSIVPIMACIVIGVAFALVRRRRPVTKVSVRVVADGQSLDSCVDPLCPASDAQGSSQFP